MSRSKGTRYERELVNLFRDDDWFAMRVWASGGGTDAELPDVIAGKDGDAYVIELKYTSSNRISVKRKKLEGLKWLAGMIGATPLVGARFSGDTTYHFFLPSQCKQNAKSVSVGKDDRDDAMHLVK